MVGNDVSPGTTDIDRVQEIEIRQLREYDDNKFWRKGVHRANVAEVLHNFDIRGKPANYLGLLSVQEES